MTNKIKETTIKGVYGYDEYKVIQSIKDSSVLYLYKNDKLLGITLINRLEEVIL